jgi:hypothetical protein
MKLKLVFGILAVLGFIQCGGASAPPSQARTLPSGRTIQVLGVGTINFPEGGPALMLKYETGIDIKDQAALRQEADEIWVDFRTEAERANVASAILSANSKPRGVLMQQAQGYNFVFQRDSTGAWKCLDDK